MNEVGEIEKASGGHHQGAGKGERRDNSLGAAMYARKKDQAVGKCADKHTQCRLTYPVPDEAGQNARGELD